MAEEKKGWFGKFMEIHCTLRFGNDGRGTKVYLFPFVGVAIVLGTAMIINYNIYGNFY